MRTVNLRCYQPPIQVLISFIKRGIEVTINQVDLKRLFSLSAGRCNICNEVVIEHDVVIGEMAHIIAKSPTGPRGDRNRANDNSYDNLILLCSKHHKIVDSRPSDYPADYLKSIKEKHEENIARRLNRTPEYEQDLRSLNILFEYIPFLRLRGMVLNLPHKLSMEFEVIEYFENFQKDNPHSYPFWDNELTHLWNNFIFATDELDNFMSSDISGNQFYAFGRSSGVSNRVNIYVGDDYGRYIVMNKRFLTSEQICLIENKITPLVQSFFDSHTELVNYIRYNFRDIRW